MPPISPIFADQSGNILNLTRNFEINLPEGMTPSSDRPPYFVLLGNVVFGRGIIDLATPTTYSSDIALAPELVPLGLGESGGGHPLPILVDTGIARVAIAYFWVSSGTPQFYVDGDVLPVGSNTFSRIHLDGLNWVVGV